MECIIVSLVSSVSTIGVIGAIGYLLRSWLLERLKAAINHEYNLKLLELEKQREMRRKAELLGDLLAQWLRKDNDIDYYELNRLSFQAFLWLPKDLAEKLSNLLAGKEGAIDIRSLIQETRSYLQEKDDEFNASDVIIFSKKE